MLRGCKKKKEARLHRWNIFLTIVGNKSYAYLGFEFDINLWSRVGSLKLSHTN